jgi:hypothetical protein
MLKPLLVVLIGMVLAATANAQGVLEVREGGAAGTIITDDQAVGGLRNFGQVPISTASPLMIHVTNTGTSPITFGVIQKIGARPGDFALGISGLVNPLPAGQSFSFAITFYRTTVGVSTSTLELTHDAASSGVSPFQINLVGEAVVFKVTLGSPMGAAVYSLQSPVGTARDFGSQDITAGATASITFYITNVSSGPSAPTISLGAPFMAGSRWYEYVIDLTGTLSQLSPGQSTSFTVTPRFTSLSQANRHPALLS